MAISRRLRFEVLRRDGHTCRYCGAKAPDATLTVDHVKPTALGGTDDATNLVAACKDCNAGKSSTNPDAPLVAQVADDALRWARAMEEVARTAALERQFLNDQIDKFDAAWGDWKYGPPEDRKTVPRKRDWPETIERFLNVGLGIDTLAHLVGVAMRRDKVHIEDVWTYFCGCCWRTIDKMQEEANRVLAFEDQWRKEIADGS